MRIGLRSFTFLSFWLSTFLLPSVLQARPAHRHLSSARTPSVIYEIFPRSFQDSGTDGIGDLRGVLNRLDYIQDLGADAIWLMPIYPSLSSHGYDVINYKGVNSDYGDLNVVKELIRNAHARGLQVLLDLPVNSTSNKHPWFIDSSTNPQSQSRSLYMWSPTPLNWTALPIVPGKTALDDWHLLGSEYYLSSFSDNLPDLNWKNEEVFRRIRDVFQYWVDQGVDGFRLDAAKHLVKGPNGEQNQPGTHAIWQRIVAESRKISPETYFIGEVWDTSANIASYYGSGRAAGLELNSAFDFPTMFALRSALMTRSAKPLVNALNARLKEMPTQDFAAPFIGNHDRSRISSEVAGDVARLKLAALIEFTLPGTPIIYYGDEIGLKNGANADHKGDLAKRTPMQWTLQPGMGFTADGVKSWLSFSDSSTNMAAQRSDPQSLLNTYRRLIQLRKSKASLHSGDLVQPENEAPGVISYWRLNSDGTGICIVVNFAQAPLTDFAVEFPHSFKSHRSPHILYGDKSTVVAKWQNEFSLSVLNGTSAAIVEF